MLPGGEKCATRRRKNVLPGGEKMRLFNIKTVKNVRIYGAVNFRCFSIACTPTEFEELKKTGVLVEDISVYDSFISITCCVNSERTQELILKAQKIGIEVKFYV